MGFQVTASRKDVSFEEVSFKTACLQHKQLIFMFF